MSSNPQSYQWMRREISRLNPETDAPRIVQLYISSTVPRSAMVSNLIYTLGLVRLCASREQSVPVHRKGRGKVYRQGDQRADETNYHLLMWIDSDLSAPHIRESLAHVRHLHDVIGRAWPMRQEAFLHALSSFTLLLDNLLTRVLGAPPLGEKEKAAFLHQFQHIGNALGIENIPATWEGMEAYLDAYEHSDCVAYSEEGAAVAHALIEQFITRWLPRPLHPQGRWLITALLEEHIVEALRLPPPPALFKGTVRRLGRVLLFVKQRLLPNPREPFSLSAATAAHPKAALPKCPVPH